MRNPVENLNTTARSALILLSAMLICGGMFAADRFRGAAVDVEEPETASEWLARAESLAERGYHEEAERACRAALALEPRHPGAARKLTLLLLERGDLDKIIDWMDDLVLRDARLAERTFELPQFEPYMEHETLRELRHEACIQARD